VRSLLSGYFIPPLPGGFHQIVQSHGGFGISDFFTTGLDPAKHGWSKWKGMFAVEYTIFAGLIGSTLYDHGDARHRSRHGPAHV